MTLDQDHSIKTGEVGHSGKLAEPLRENPVKPDGTPLVEQSAPSDISDLLKLQEQTTGGAVEEATGTETSTEADDDIDSAPATLSTPNKKKWHQKTWVRLAGAALVASPIVIPATVAAVSAYQAEVAVPNPGQIPEPGSPDYDAFQKIGNNSDITIGDVDRLLTYFNSGEMDRKALITALAQANQQEVDHIFEVMGNTDDADNIDVTNTLAQYGLETSEVPRDLMGRISEKNDLVEQDIDAIAAFYQDVPYDDLRAALADLTPEEASTALEVINGTASLNEMNEIFRSHGLDVGGDFVS